MRKCLGPLHMSKIYWPAHPSSQSLSSSSRSFKSSGLIMAGRTGLSVGLRIGCEESRGAARTKRFSLLTSPLQWDYGKLTTAKYPRSLCQTAEKWITTWIFKMNLLYKLRFGIALPKSRFAVKTGGGCYGGGNMVCTRSFTCLFRAHLKTAAPHGTIISGMQMPNTLF